MSRAECRTSPGECNGGECTGSPGQECPRGRGIGREQGDRHEQSEPRQAPKANHPVRGKREKVRQDTPYTPGRMLTGVMPRCRTKPQRQSLRKRHPIYPDSYRGPCTRRWRWRHNGLHSSVHTVSGNPAEEYLQPQIGHIEAKGRHLSGSESATSPGTYRVEA